MKKLVVFGSFVVDLMSRADHLPVPGETVKGSVFQSGPGGKGFNQGIAAHKAGGQVILSTKIGDDMFASYATDTMKSLNMPLDYVFVSGTDATGTALIMVDENTSQNAILVVPSACNTITDEEVDRVLAEIDADTIVLTQLETNLEAVYRLVRGAKEKGAFVVLNPAPYCPFDRDLLTMIDIITPNETEAQWITGIPVESEEGAKKASENMRDAGVKTVLITLGERGSYLMEGETAELIPAFPVKALDTTGAGDAFNGGLVTALAEGKDIHEAIRFASALAALSVQKLGTTMSMPVREEIDAFLKEV